MIPYSREMCAPFSSGNLASISYLTLLPSLRGKALCLCIFNPYILFTTSLTLNYKLCSFSIKLLMLNYSLRCLCAHCISKLTSLWDDVVSDFVRSSVIICYIEVWLERSFGFVCKKKKKKKSFQEEFEKALWFELKRRVLCVM